MAARSVTIELEVRGKQARQALEGIEGGATELRQIVDDPMQLRFDADRARTALEGVESGVTDLQRTAQQAASVTNRSTNEMASGFNRASQNVGGTTTAVTNLNRIVQDAPFGVMGVANNIEPFIQSFQRLQKETGSTKTAMKTLISGAFTGPGALITIVSVVTAALSAIQMGIIDLGGNAEDTEGQLKAMLDAVEELQGVVDEDLGLAGQINREIDRNKEAIRIAEQKADLQYEIDRLSALGAKRRTQQQDQELQRLRDRRNGLDELITRLGFENNALTDLEQNLDNLRRKQELYNGSVGTSEQRLAAFVDSIQADADQALNRFQAGLVGGEQAVEDQVDSLETIISTYQGAAEAGEDQYIPVIIQLQKKVEELRKELGEKTSNDGFVEQQIRNYEYLDQLLNGVIEKTKGQKLTAQARGSVGFSQTEQPTSGIVSPNISTDFSIGPQQGSIAAKKQELKELQWMYENTPFGEARKELSKQIKQAKSDIEDMGGSLEDTGDAGEAALRATTAAAQLLGNALAQAIIRGEKLGGVLKSLAAQLASQALINGLKLLLTGGSFSFTKLLFGGFAQGTDMGFPGVGKVGERGEELIVAPPMSSIITNENIEKMSRMRKEARQATTVASNIDTQQMAEQIKQSVYEGFQQAPIYPQVDIIELNEAKGRRDNFNSRIGN